MMARSHIKNPKSLAFKHCDWDGANPDAAATSTTLLTDATVTDGRELVEVKDQAGDVATHYAGDLEDSIQATLLDAEVFLGLAKGDTVADVVVTAGGAKMSDGTVVGSDRTYTLTFAVVSEIGEVTLNQENGSPAGRSVTFKAARLGTNAGAGAWATVT